MKRRYRILAYGLRTPKRMLGRLSYWRAGLRTRRDFVRQRIAGTTPLSDATARVALFVSYDRAGTVHDYVFHYLEDLRRAGFEIVFISNSPLLPEAAVARLRPLCGLIIHRENVGYDFGAYKDGIAAVSGLPSLDQVMLANDSVYGPFRPLSELLDRGSALWDRADIWGMTDSWDKSYHLQSYFVVFGRKALSHPAFATFWSRLRYVQSKEWVSQKYEVELSRTLIKAGLRCAAFCSYRAVAEEIVRQTLADEQSGNALTHLDRHRHVLAEVIERGVPLNATHFFWRQLIEFARYPFIKRELLEVNPMRLPGVSLWEDVIRGVSDYDTDLIARHLEHRLKHRYV